MLLFGKVPKKQRKLTKKQIIMTKFYQFWSYLEGHFVDKSSTQINSFFALLHFFAQ